MSVTYSST